MTIASAVDWDAILEVIWVSLLAGVGVTVAFSAAILGATRAVDLRQDGHAVAATMMVAVMVIAVLITAGAIVFGIVVMTQK